MGETGAGGSVPEALAEIRAVALDLVQGLAHYPDLAAALDYWRGKRAGRFAPARADIDPAEMTDFLPRVLLADVLRTADGGLDFRYRLCGTGICTVHGTDLTEQRPSELLPPAYGRLIESHYRDVVAVRAPCAHIILLNTDRVSRSYARVLMPLSEDGEAVTMLMCVDSERQNSLHEFLEVIDALGDA